MITVKNVMVLLALSITFQLQEVICISAANSLRSRERDDNHLHSKDRVTISGRKPNESIVLELDGSKRLVLKSGSEIPCTPVFDSSSNVFAVSRDDNVEAYNAAGIQLWSAPMDYYYNPSQMLATGGIVVYDHGADHLPVGDFDVWRSISLKSQRIAARDSVSGRLIWDRPWLEIGNPRVSGNNGVIYTVRFPLPSRIKDIEMPRHGFLDVRQSRTGDLIRSWALPKWMLGHVGAVESTVSLSDWLSLPSSKWTVKTKNGVDTIRVFATYNTPRGDRPKVPLNCVCTMCLGRSKRLKIECGELRSGHQKAYVNEVSTNGSKLRDRLFSREQ